MSQLIGRNLRARMKDSLKQKVQRIDQRLLAAKVEMQRNLLSAGGLNRRAHLAKDVHVSAAKTVNRLFAIADDEQVRSLHHSQLRHQIALQAIGVLELVDQKETITLGDAAHHFRMLVQQLQRAQLQVVEINY